MGFSMSLFSRISRIIFFTALLSAQGFVIARAAAMTPTGVYNKVAELRMGLETIRAHLGALQNQQPEIPVTEVSPREVFYQAKTMQEKVYLLASEQMAGNENERKIFSQKGVIQPKHVFAVVDDAVKRLQQVIEKLNLPKA